MKAAADGDRLSLLSLAYKHRYGLDGFDKNLHQSFCKFRKLKSFNSFIAIVKSSLIHFFKITTVKSQKS